VTRKGQYRELFENAADIVYTHDLEGNFRSVNKAVERVAGYSRAEVSRMSLFQLLEPDSSEAVRETIRAILGGSPRTTFEVTLLTRDRRQIALEIGCRLVFRRGRPVGVQGIARDITERKRAEALERDRNRVLELVAGNESLGSVFGSLCLLVERQIPAVRCAVLAYREGRLTLGAAPSMPAAFAGIFEGPEPTPAAAAWGTLLGSGLPARVNLTSEPALETHRSLLSESNLEAGWATPILSREGTLLGAFLLLGERDPETAPGELPGLEAARRLAVVAIEHRQLNDQLAHQARHDALTGLPNRLLFEERLAQALEEARRHNWLLAVLFIDLDRFKQINDTLGHPTGDVALGRVAERLAASVRKSDCLARLGGDEFGLVLTELNDGHDAFRVGQKLLEALSPPLPLGTHEMVLTASIGISLYPRDGRDAATLRRNADTAMYRAKNRGRNQIEFFTAELGLAALEKMEIEHALRRALEYGELELYYQPQTEAGHRLVGLEALLVWNHPKLGTTSPQEFLPVAEESGMIVPIGVWALRSACLQNAKWQRVGFPRLRVAVNVSPIQFARPDFVETVAQALAESGLDPSLLELELTENVVMREPEESVRQMQRLRALGVGLAIDDFGTGYSSLSYLRLLPIDSLKVDRSFVKEVEKDPNTIPLVRAIVALAHGLGLTVVAEGVETQQQFEVLRQIGCDRFQGYLLGEAAPAAMIERLLEAAGSMLR